MKRILVWGCIIGVVVGFGIQWAVEGESSSKYTRDTLNWVEEMVIDETNVPEPHLLVNPFSVTEDADGNIYIADVAVHNIKKFKPNGTFISAFGKQGTGPGDLNGPASIVFAGGKLVINDMMNRRFSLFEPDGNFFRSVKVESTNELCKKLKTGANGLLAVEFEKFESKPNEPQRISIHTTLGPKLFETFNVIFQQNVQLRKLISTSMPMNIVVPFPATVCWDTLPGGKLAIGYSETYDIGVYDPVKGKIATLSRKYEPIKVEDADKKEFFGKLRFFEDGKMTNNVPQHVRENTDFPRFKPAFEAIFADSGGYILVFPFQKANDKKDRRQVDVFRADGTFIRTITLVGKMNLYALSRGNGDYFWSSKTNDDGEASIVKYRLK